MLIDIWQEALGVAHAAAVQGQFVALASGARKPDCTGEISPCALGIIAEEIDGLAEVRLGVVERGREAVDVAQPGDDEDPGRPGVGQRLMDHPSISLSSFVRRGARMNGHTRRHMQMALRYSSGLPGIPAGDMFVVVITKSAWHAVGEQIASLLTFINKTYSETGQVKLASRDFRQEPIVEFNLLSDKRDLDRLMSGFKLMAALQMTDSVREVTDEVLRLAASLDMGSEHPVAAAIVAPAVARRWCCWFRVTVPSFCCWRPFSCPLTAIQGQRTILANSRWFSGV